MVSHNTLQLPVVCPLRQSDPYQANSLHVNCIMIGSSGPGCFAEVGALISTTAGDIITCLSQPLNPKQSEFISPTAESKIQNLTLHKKPLCTSHLKALVNVFQNTHPKNQNIQKHGAPKTLRPSIPTNKDLKTKTRNPKRFEHFADLRTSNSGDPRKERKGSATVTVTATDVKNDIL